MDAAERERIYDEVNAKLGGKPREPGHRHKWDEWTSGPMGWFLFMCHVDIERAIEARDAEKLADRIAYGRELAEMMRFKAAAEMAALEWIEDHEGGWELDQY